MSTNLTAYRLALKNIYKQEKTVIDNSITVFMVVRLATSYSPGTLRSKYHRRWK
ncbi:hypothetical protein M2277_005871, partial [Paenibacillus sp. LBL]|nr:hypothetical protein [Paenibacillus sp. LBL]